MNSKEALAEALKRENIPSIDKMPTLYRPTGSGVMIVPLSTHDTDAKGQACIGTILIPGMTQELMRAQMNEGHVIAIGPNVKGVEVGDCVCWSLQQQYRFELEDGSEFVNIIEGAVLLRIPKAELEKSKATRDLSNGA